MHSEIIREGRGLHGGAPSCVILRARPGPVSFFVEGRDRPLHDCTVVSTARATTIAAGGVRVATVEHLFAACAGMSLHEGLSIEVVGNEMPLLDGGARSWSDALFELAVASSAGTLEVLREDEVTFGRSSYRFAPGQTVTVEARVDFGDPRIDGLACWSGDPVDFRARIAPARTFALAHEVQELEREGLAAHFTPESVVIIGPETIFQAGPAYAHDEPARHKLLDLMGDLFLYGGPPRGLVRAYRPGHTATHAVMKLALSRGIVGPAVRNRRHAENEEVGGQRCELAMPRLSCPASSAPLRRIAE